MRLQVRVVEKGGEGKTAVVSSAITTTNYATSAVSAGSANIPTVLAVHDDSSIHQWSLDGEYVAAVLPASDAGCVDASLGENLAVATGDGALKWLNINKTAGGSNTRDVSGALMPVSLKEERSVAVCSGAAIAVRWSPDLSAVAVGGEDGSLKVYSRNGMLRTTLIPSGKPVYALSWTAEGQSIIYATGRDISIVSLSADAGARGRAVSWRAHDALVTALDCSGSRTQAGQGAVHGGGVGLASTPNPSVGVGLSGGQGGGGERGGVQGRIVSGGEDGRYKVWDCMGRLIFASLPAAKPITSVAWAPRGDLFAVGSYDLLRVCDAAGWSAAMEIAGTAATSATTAATTSAAEKLKLSTGSITSLSWSPDGMRIVAGGATGALMFARLLDVTQSAGGVDVTLVAPDRLHITDTTVYAALTSSVTAAPTDAAEDIELRDAVLTFAVGFGHVVAATASHLSIYTGPMWSTAHTIDTPKSPVRFLLLSGRHFAAVDAAGALNIYSYDGRTLCTVKSTTPFRSDSLSKGVIALSPDVVSYIDKSEGGKAIRSVDIRTGRPLANSIVHHAPITSIGVSQGLTGGIPERKVVFTDASQDLFISGLVKPQPFKLAAMVDSASWNDNCDILCAVTDGQCVTWLVPGTAALDAELCDQAKVVLDPAVFATFGADPTIEAFQGPRVTIRKTDGCLAHAIVSNYAPLLFECTSAGKWAEAVRLARFVHHDALWAALSLLALQAKQLDTAEIALAAVKAVDKLAWVNSVKRLPLQELKNAELAFYKRQVDEAEGILLQAQPMLLYRAIKLNIRAARWERALQLATQHKAHVDTVLWYRQQFLQSMHRTESIDAFARAADSTGPLNVDAIKARKRAEKEKEGGRKGVSAAKVSASDGKEHDEIPEHEL